MWTERVPSTNEKRVLRESMVCAEVENRVRSSRTLAPSSNSNICNMRARVSLPEEASNIMGRRRLRVSTLWDCLA